MMNPCEVWNSPRTETTHVYALKNISPMENHPFGVRDDEDMEALVESIRQYGVLNPIIVRERRHFGDNYEIVSGHRRYEACKRLGKFDIPVIVRDLTDEEAILTMVDSNLHRERLLPSEKAFAYKMKLDALKRQGKRTDLTSAQVAPKLSTEIIAEQENTSKDTIKRYIRLTKLIKPLLDMVDEGKIVLTPAEKLSYLTEEEQTELVKQISELDATPSLSQAVKLKALSESKKLDAENMTSVMERPKANQKELLKLDMGKLRTFFPDSTPKDMEAEILRILNDWQRMRQRTWGARERDER